MSYPTNPASWSPDRNPVDYIYLGGESINDQSPGIAELVGVSAPRNIQVMTGMGWNDARIRFAGFKPQEFSVKLHLYNSDDWFAWHDWKKRLVKRVQETGGLNTKVAKPLSISHPFLLDPTIGINAVIVQDVLAPVAGDETGEWIIEIKFISYRQPKQQFLPYEGKASEPTMTPKEQENAAKLAALIGQSLPAPK